MRLCVDPEGCIALLGLERDRARDRLEEVGEAIDERRLQEASSDSIDGQEGFPAVHDPVASQPEEVANLRSDVHRAPPQLDGPRSRLGEPVTPDARRKKDDASHLYRPWKERKRTRAISRLRC